MTAPLLPPDLRPYSILLKTPFHSQVPVTGWKEAREMKLWYPEYSLVFVVDKIASKFLMGLKRRGMGTGLYNGYGGKPEVGEDMLDCAIRELQEESGLEVLRQNIDYKGLLLTSRPTAAGQSDKHMLRIHIYACTSWSGDPVETEEMTPEWFTFATLPHDRMWPEARLYLPAVLRSILRDQREEIFLGRVDYEFLKSDSAPTTFPPLQGSSIRFEETSDAASDEEVPLERLSGWWMTFTTQDTVLQIENAKNTPGHESGQSSSAVQA